MSAVNASSSNALSQVNGRGDADDTRQSMGIENTDNTPFVTGYIHWWLGRIGVVSGKVNKQ